MPQRKQFMPPAQPPRIPTHHSPLASTARPMPESTSFTALRDRLRALRPAAADYATRFAELLLAGSRELGASDIHLLPQAQQLAVKLRIDGLLAPLGMFACGEGSDIVTRLKVMAGLLTYRTEIPQEGRIQVGASEAEMRVSTFPTLHGERAVVRMFAAEGTFERLADLGLPADVAQPLRDLLAAPSGALIIAGPAGAGKTTTAYALLRELAAGDGAGGKSIFSLEDPIESAIEGVAQSKVSYDGPLTYAVGLRSLLRQDPEVIYVGEMRDEPTARIAMQAALTGHLLITTFHAGRAAAVISRLSEMGLESYVLRSGIRAVLCQWLVRRLCQCATAGQQEADRLGLEVSQWRMPGQCELCRGSGYRGRTLIAEFLPLEQALGREPFHQLDAAAIEALAVERGMVSRWQHANAAVEAGITSPPEVRRVLGLAK